MTPEAHRSAAHKETVLICDQILGYQDEPIGQISAGKIVVQGSAIREVTLCSATDYPARKKEWCEMSPQARDLSGYLITPALINAHTHLAMSFFRGIGCESAAQGNMIEDLFYRMESLLSPEDVRSFARMGAWENLLAGNALVWDHYYHGRSLASAAEETGLCAVIAPTIQDLAGPGQSRWEEEWSATLDIHHSEQLRKQGIFAAFGPHATDTVSGKLWQQITAAAASEKLPIHSHHAQSSEEYQRCLIQHHCSPTAWLNQLGVFDQGVRHLLVHNIFIHQHELAFYRKPGITAAFCPFSSLIFAFPSRVLGWEDSGINWTIGTDCVASNDSMNLQKELRYLSGIPMQSVGFSEPFHSFFHQQTGSASALTEERNRLFSDYAAFRDHNWLLKKVLSIPGSLHPDFLAGLIAPSYLANLIIWDIDHPSVWPFRGAGNLTMGDTGAAIWQMMCRGQWMGEGGNFHHSLRNSTIYQDHLEEASRRLRDLRKRSGLMNS